LRLRADLECARRLHRLPAPQDRSRRRTAPDPDGARRRLRPPRVMSFRVRLTLAATLAVTAAIVLASVLVYVLVSDRLNSEIDGTLRDRAAAVTHSEPPSGNIFGNVPPAILGQARGFYQYADSHGNAVLPPFENGQPQLPIDRRTMQVAAGKHDAYFSDRTVMGVHLRVYTVPAEIVNTDPPTPIAVQVALPLTEVDSTLSRLGWILFFVSLGGVGLAVVLGWLVTRATLAPVLRLLFNTEEITE